MEATVSRANDNGSIQDEIDDLEAKLAAAKLRLQRSSTSDTPAAVASRAHQPSSSLPLRTTPTLGSPTHFLLLLADSALPLGAFAFSSGLESFLAHAARGEGTFTTFLPSSLSSFGSTTLPFVLAAHRDPASLVSLDDQLDAAIVCTVGRRASVAQGRALLSVWERSFKPNVTAAGSLVGDSDGSLAVLREYSALLRDGKEDLPLVSAHLAPLFGAVCALLGLGLRQTAYVFMLSHVKALISAAVRASMFGPFHAQKLLAAGQVQSMIDVVIDREWDTPVEEAGQSVPVMDLWFGRHELLYSRIFNS